MSTPTAMISHDEAVKLAGHLDSLSYEYGGILPELQSDEERESFGAKAERATVIAAELAHRATARGSVSLPREIFTAALTDLDWLVGEWGEAMDYMDKTDTADYKVRRSALERFLAQIRTR